MSAPAIDLHLSDQAAAWWFLDTLVVEHPCAPAMETVVLEMTLPVGSTPPLHIHANLDDSWYVLQGKMAVRVGDSELVASAGDWVSMPRDVPHSFRVIGDCNARILMVHDNGSFRDLVRELGVPATEQVLPKEPVFPQMPDLARIARTHDLTPVGPPMTTEDADAIVASVSQPTR